MADRRARKGDTAGRDGPIVIKKYANRRLYNTSTAEFVTLDALRDLVTEGKEFIVQDEKTGKDITASVLVQIIAEQEVRGESLLPVDMLRQVIAFYDKGMGGMLSDYLDRSMVTFQESWNRFGGLGDISRHNIEMFRQSLGLFMPGFQKPPSGEGSEPTAGEAEAAEAGDDQPAEDDGEPDEVDALRDQLADIQARLDSLSRDQKK